MRTDHTHDLSKPITVTLPQRKSETNTHTDLVYNRYLLTERELKGRRTVIKLTFEVYARKSARRFAYSRMRNRGVLVSCPSSDQAELFLTMIEKIAASMNGKLLARDMASME